MTPRSEQKVKNPKPLSLIGVFTATNLFLFVIMGVFVVGVIQPALERFFLDTKKAETVVFVNRFANEILYSDDLLLPLTSEKEERLRRFVTNLTVPGLIGVFVVNSAGTIVYTDQPEYINTNFGNPLELRSVIEDRQAFSGFMRLSPSEANRFGAEEIFLQILPLTFGEELKVTGAIYALSRTGSVRNVIQNIERDITRRIVGVFAAVYMAGAAVIVVASRIIHRQSRALEVYAATLEQQVAKRTAELQELNQTLKAKVQQEFRARQKVEMLLEGMGEGVVVIDRRWRIVLWNKAAQDLCQWKKEKVLDKPFREVINFIRAHDRAEQTLFIEEAMLTGKITQPKENMVLVGSTGIEMAVEGNAAPIINQEGQAEGAIIVFRDVTKEREANRLRSDFAYASHQLRTPVTEALGFVELLLDEKDPAAKERAQIAFRSLANVRKLVNELIEVSELDQDRMIPDDKPLKVIDAFEEVVRLTEKEAERKNVSLVVEPVSPLLGIRTDPTFLKRILFEVVINAILYNIPGGSVRLGLVPTNKELVFEVEDTGTGIAENEQTLVFTKFFRGVNASSAIVGAGLGLYIARAYITLLKGKIWFHSEKGKTIFYISLPLTSNGEEPTP